jgi:CheY-like chemotaxis protein
MVLVVDDEAVVRRALVHALQALSYDVLEAGDGQEALLELAKRRSEISLVILDLSMPRMNGREALAKIHQRWPDLRVLMVTGSPPSDVEDLVANGTPVLHKPYGLQELKRAIVGDTGGA